MSRILLRIYKKTIKNNDSILYPTLKYFIFSIKKSQFIWLYDIITIKIYVAAETICEIYIFLFLRRLTVQVKNMRKALLSFLLVAVFMLSSCLPEVKLDYEEPKEYGDITIILEETYYSYGYRTARYGNSDVILTELCEIHNEEISVMFSLHGTMDIMYTETYDRAGDYMYFQANQNGQFEYTILVYNKKTGFTKKLTEATISNLVVPPSSSEVGYYLQESTIVALDLDTCTVDDTQSMSMESGVMFFYYNSDQYYKKASHLTVLDDRTLQVQVGTFYYSDSTVPETSVYYQYDTIGQNTWGPY